MYFNPFGSNKDEILIQRRIEENPEQKDEIIAEYLLANILAVLFAPIVVVVVVGLLQYFFPAMK